MALRKFSILLLVLLFPILLIAQDREEKLSTKSKRAERAYQNATEQYNRNNIPGAMESLKVAIREDTGFCEAYLLLGQISMELKEKDKALGYYRRATEIKPDIFPPVYTQMAEMELGNGDYKNAKKHLEQFLSFRNVLPARKVYAQKKLEICDFAIHALENPVPFDPVNLGDSINSRYDDYVNAVTADDQTLLFTVKRPKDKETLIQENKYEEDFYIARKINGVWQKALNLGRPVNTHGNEGAGCLSPDGMILFFTACQRPEGFGSCDIYMSRRMGDGWSQPVNLGPIVNSERWDSQPSLSSDGKTLYFASTREGSRGKSDIWKTTMKEDGAWTAPVNLGDSINTTGTEMSPFIHPDGQTLYFSSDGHPGMGGADLFYSRKKPDDTWTSPVNLGYPINSYEDEVNIIVNGKGDLAYFSSAKTGGLGKMDIYSFELYEKARPFEVSYLKGIVFSSLDKKRLEAKFQLIDLETGETVVESLSDPVNGEFLVCLPLNRNYALNVSRDGFLFYSENFPVKDRHTQFEPLLKDIALQPIKVGETVILNNIFFETAKYDLKEESKIELNKLVELMRRNPRMTIEISGHTDNVGDEKYNLELSLNRAGSVYNYLINNGIPKERLTFKGYGKSRPVSSNDTEEGRARNRRTEFKVLSY